MNLEKGWDFQTFIQTFKDLTISNFNDNDHLEPHSKAFQLTDKRDE